MIRSNQDIALVDMFLGAYPPGIRVANDSGWTPLFCAIHARNDPAVILHLLTVWPGCARYEDREGDFPLHAALENDASYDVIRALLEANPDAVRHATTRLTASRYISHFDVPRILM